MDHPQPASFEALERLADECVQTIARDAVRRAAAEVPAATTSFVDIESWAYPLALSDGQHEPAGLDDVPGAAERWPAAHAAWAQRPLHAVAAEPLRVVVLDRAPGEWPGCLLAIGEERGEPVVLAAALVGSDLAAAQASMASDLRRRGHRGPALGVLPETDAGDARHDPPLTKASPWPPPSVTPPVTPPRTPARLRTRTLIGLALALAITVVLVPGGAGPPTEPRVTTLIRELSAAQPVELPAKAAPSPDTGSDAPDTAADTPPESDRRDDNPNVFVPAAFLAAGERGSTPLGLVNIPALSMTTPFTSGVHEDVLTDGPGHWPGTPLPGQVGNSVLSGHRTTHTAPFRDLDQLMPGQHIGVTVGQGREVVFEVIDTQIVSEADYVEVVTAQPDRLVRQITLFACDPPGQRTHRIVVRAQVSPRPLVATGGGGPSS